MQKFLFAGLLGLALSFAAGAQPVDPKSPPAFRLGDAAIPLDYKARLSIDPDAERFEGEIRIRMRIGRATPMVWMHARKLEIVSAEFRQGTRAIGVTSTSGGNEFVGFEAKGEPFAAGEAEATIRYTGSVDALSTRGLFRQKSAGDWYVVSQFEADSARFAFPCFDEPGWKTPWQLTIDAPAANVVVSNTPETSVSDTPGRPGWKRHAFAATKPLPSYLVALSVGPFDVVEGGTAGRNKTPLRYLAPKGRGAEMRWVKESTPRILEILEDYFGMPYPFEKLDTVTVGQAVNFGAMENVGMITYVESLLLAKPNEETPAFRRRYTAVGAHEIAHMWFGNLVTLAWWDDTWLNESFASWMGDKTVTAFNPEWGSAYPRNVTRNRSLFADRLATARPLHNPVLEKGDIDASFNRLTYDKGAQVLSMFEGWLTPERFRHGVREYMAARAYGSATSQDFFRAVGDAADKRDAALAAFSTFVNQPGAPMMDAVLRCDAKGAAVLDVVQSAFQPQGARASNASWTTPACFAYEAGGSVKKQCAEVANGKATIALPAAQACPRWVAWDSGYFVMRPDAALAKRNLPALAAWPDTLAVPYVNDASLMQRSGVIGLDRVLPVYKAALAHKSPGVRRAAVEALKNTNPEHVTGSAKAARAAIDRDVVLPLARQMGWTEKPGESDEVRELRFVLLPYAADYAGDEALRAQARDLARQWLRDRSGADAMMVTPILDTAARFADAGTYAAFEAEAATTQNLRDRRQIVSALAKVRDPALRPKALGLALDKRSGQEVMNGREALLFLEDATEDDGNRRAAFAYLRDNFDALAAKLPPETPGQLVRHLDRMCTPQDRSQVAAFFKDRSPRFVGGPRRLEQALEGIDLCVAAGTPRV
ncbi:Aminopeptidase N [Usitatibacter rugosus]|uniref:Aminopeptidase n=1 Tax=Usitatibacter rugosus TaxID=2732067 RepID=A0A6M4H1G1_9PROT|nr:M1 family metallopeptidase [Usitatibacter rugosus]QJR13172.1 Aminopeptidase N [Usitatibacter rugosus]